MTRSRRFTRPVALVAVLALALSLVLGSVGGASATVATADPTRLSTPEKLVFVHHSTGEAWLADDYGALGKMLLANGYFVSDTNYGWGPTVAGDAIGSHTDIGDWWTWFRGPSASVITTALYTSYGQNCSYSRGRDPGGPNRIIVFKSCFPNSELGGLPGAAIPTITANPMRGKSAGDASYTVANAKGIYRDLLNYFATRQDRLFVLIVSPPMTSIPHASNARAMADWLVSPTGWLADYPYANVAVFDYYNVLTSNGGSTYKNDYGTVGRNHHRYRNDVIEHTHTVANNLLAYPSAGGDSHPSRQGDLKATAEFIPLLNAAYNRWRVATAPARQGVHHTVEAGVLARARAQRVVHRVRDDERAARDGGCRDGAAAQARERRVSDVRDGFGAGGRGVAVVLGTVPDHERGHVRDPVRARRRGSSVADERVGDVRGAVRGDSAKARSERPPCQDRANCSRGA